MEKISSVQFLPNSIENGFFLAKEVILGNGLGYSQFVMEEGVEVPLNKRRKFIEKCLLVICGFICFGFVLIISHTMYHIIIKKNCVNPLYTTEIINSFNIEENHPQFLEIHIVSGEIEVKLGHEVNVTIRTVLGADTQESLQQMKMNFTSFDSGYRFVEEAKRFEMFENCQSAKISVFIPHGVDLSNFELSIRMDSGMVRVQLDNSHLASLHISVGGGWVSVMDVNVDHSNISISSGSIKLQRMTGVDSKLSLKKVGQVKLENLSIQNLNVSAHRGEIKIEDITRLNITNPQSISASLHQGKVSIDGVNEANMTIFVAKGYCKMDVNNKIFGGKYFLKGNYYIDGDHIEQTNSTHMGIGLIGDVKKLQLIDVTVVEGNIKLKIE